MPNLKWSFIDSHMRLEEGGWARQTTIRELPISTEMAGVNMWLKTNVAREMHWHKEAEWSYVIKGQARITAIDQDGHTFIADVGEGDLWYSRRYSAFYPGSGGEDRRRRIPSIVRRWCLLRRLDVPHH